MQDFPFPQYRGQDRHRTVFFDAGEGDEAIVFVHGLGGNLTHWALVAPAFERTHRVIGIDLPGFGATRRLRGPCTYDRLADEVFGLMDRRGVKRATLVGHSFGGAVVTHMALRAPERLRGLVVVSPAGFFRYPAWMRIGSRVLFNPLVMASGLCFGAPFVTNLVVSSKGPGVDVFNRAAWQLSNSLKFLTNSTLAAHALRPELVERQYLDRLAEIDVPMHMVWGSADRLLSASQGLEAMAATPGGRLTRLPGVGHMPIFEQPAAVIDAIGDVERRGLPTELEPKPLPASDVEWESLARALEPEPAAAPNLAAAVLGAHTL